MSASVKWNAPYSIYYVHRTQSQYIEALFMLLEILTNCCT